MWWPYFFCHQDIQSNNLDQLWWLLAFSGQPPEKSKQITDRIGCPFVFHNGRLFLWRGETQFDSKLCAPSVRLVLQRKRSLSVIGPTPCYKKLRLAIALCPRTGRLVVCCVCHNVYLLSLCGRLRTSHLRFQKNKWFMSFFTGKGFLHARYCHM